MSQRETIRPPGIGLDLMDDFLARSVADLFRSRVQEMNSLFQQRETFAQIGWRFCFENQLNFLRDLVNALAAERHRDPLARTHRVNRDWKFRNLSVNDWLLEEQRLSTAGRFHLAVRPFGNEQIGVYRIGDARQFASLLERFEKMSK